MRTLRDVCYAVLIALLVWKTVPAATRLARVTSEIEGLREANTARVVVEKSPLVEQAARLYAPLDGGGSVNREQLTSGESLFLVFGNGLPKSGRAVFQWMRLLQRIQWRSDHQVFIVVDRSDGDVESLARAAASAGVRTRLLCMANRSEFAVTTGVTIVPSALLFKDGRLALMAMGPMESDDENLFVERLQRPGLQPLRTPFMIEHLGDGLNGRGETDTPGAGLQPSSASNRRGGARNRLRFAAFLFLRGV
jgi:hypothetical protein